MRMSTYLGGNTVNGDVRETKASRAYNEAKKDQATPRAAKERKLKERTTSTAQPDVRWREKGRSV